VLVVTTLVGTTLAAARREVGALEQAKAKFSYPRTADARGAMGEVVPRALVVR